jgi:cytochrome c oxidase subunit 1
VCRSRSGRPHALAALGLGGFWLVIAGRRDGARDRCRRQRDRLYTFYPPLTGSPFYYLGVLIAVVGSWIWIGLMVANFARFKRDHPGLPVPLAMFATTAGALLWAWTSLGVGAEILFLILPNLFGWSTTIDAGLARMLFSWTLHAIVYFWLMPAYIALYVLLPQAAGGRLYSDRMGRIAFLLLLVFSMRSAFTICSPTRRSVPDSSSSIAVFTGHGRGADAAHDLHDLRSLEIAGRLRGGQRHPGVDCRTCPWDRPLGAGLRRSRS